MPGGALSTSYSQPLPVTGGVTPYASYSAGALPAGLTLNTSTGIISGTPTSPGFYTFSATVTDSLGQTATQTISLTIAGSVYVVGQGTAGAVSSFSVSPGAATGAGDCLFAWVTSNSALFSSVSDPVNGNWTPYGQAAVTSGGTRGRWYVMPSAAALSTSQPVTATFTATGGTKTLQVFGCPGLSANPLDAAPAPPNGTGTTITAASGLLTFPNELVLCGSVSGSGSGAPSWAAPFSVLGAGQHPSGGQWASAAYDSVTSSASVIAAATIVSTNWAASLISLTLAGEIMQQEAAGSADQAVIAASAAAADSAGSADALLPAAAVPLAEAAGAAEAIGTTAAAAVPEAAGAADSISVFIASSAITLTDYAAAADASAASGNVTLSFLPAAAAATVTGEQAVQVLAVPLALPAASPAFIRSQMPRLYLQDLPTGRWLNRDVQGTASPSVGWQLNAAGSFSCTLSPPRADMLDATGNPVVSIWRTACYLEQDDEIKWGGILTACNPQGDQLALTFTEFSGYPNGIPYEGPNISKTDYDALDAVRAIWEWLQEQTGGNLGLVLDAAKAGVQLGNTGALSTVTLLSGNAQAGATTIQIVPLPPPPAPPPGTPPSPPVSAWTPKARIQVGDETHSVKSAPANGHTITLNEKISSMQPAGSVVGLIAPETPYTLNWWDGTDCGQEISSIQQEAPFDFREVHAWTDSTKTAVSHRLALGVPRIGSRKTDLRFAEGENIVVPGQGTQDGSRFANNVAGIGAGSGSATVRSGSAVADGRIRRVTIYTNQTADRPDRLAALTNKILAAVSNPDTITTIVVMDHSNAAFGTFGPGDDILVQLASGWRNALIWSRITAMQQDPTTNLITLTLARSDSFTYIAQSGSAGAI
jgi:hypothetical protein